MKRMIFLVVLFFPFLAMSQTNVSGNQSGTWSLAQSPYLVTGNVTVPAGQTLTIEAGVEVNFQGHYQLIVHGNLQAVGTESSMITFTTDSPTTGWGGVRVDSSDTIRLVYCRLEHGLSTGDYPDIHGGALALLTADATVEHCVFADNSTDTDGMGGAVYAYNTTSTTFSECLFLRNHSYGEGGAIKFSGDSNGEVTNCGFFHNTTDYGGGAISFYMVSETTLRGCSFAHNSTTYSNGGALQTLGMGNTLYVVNCSFTDNHADNGDGGAASFAYVDAYFVNTIVYDNPGAYSDDVQLGTGAAADINYCNMPMPTGATGAHNLNADPDFVDAAQDDLDLEMTSPCIDAGIAHFETGGVTLVDLTPDQYDGSAPDIGASEYISTIFGNGFETGDTSNWTTVFP